MNLKNVPVRKKRIAVQIGTALSVWGLLVALVTPVRAHNGAVALAYPVEGIVVDGDFSDWPEDLPRYSITRTESGVLPGGPGDLSASFQIGYDAAEKALYVAVAVVDESVFIDTSQARNWDTEDGCEVYIGLDHVDESPASQFILRGNGTPDQRLGTDGAELVRWRRDENGHRYEWRLRLPELFETALLQGVAIAADVVVCDKDADGSFTWMAWGARGYKVSVHRLGDLALTSNPDAVGTLMGRAVLQGTERVIRGVTVRLERADDPEQSACPSTIAVSTSSLKKGASLSCACIC